MLVGVRSRCIVALAIGAACSSGGDARPDDPGLSGLGLRALEPDVILPGTILSVEGESFVSEDWGASQLHLQGRRGGENVSLRLPLGYVDETTLEAIVDDHQFQVLGGDGSELDVFVTVEVQSAVDSRIYHTGGIDAELVLHAALTPRVDSMAQNGVIFPNEPIAVIGSGFLLPGEGETHAVASGCFTAEGETSCVAAGPVDLPLVVDAPFDRTHGTFAFLPEVAGIM